VQPLVEHPQVLPAGGALLGRGFFQHNEEFVRQPHVRRRRFDVRRLGSALSLRGDAEVQVDFEAIGGVFMLLAGRQPLCELLARACSS